MDTLSVTKEFEIFNQKKFDTSEKMSEYTVREKLPDGRYIEMDQGQYGKAYSEILPNSYFALTKLFYKNGNIKSKGLSFNVPWGGFQKGTWYFFNEEGKLKEEINFDEPYKFSFENIVIFCQHQGIPLKAGAIIQGSGFKTTIQREEDKKTRNYKWKINWLKSPNTIEEIELDGVTGKVIKRVSKPYINN